LTRKKSGISSIVGISIEKSKFGSSLNDPDVWAKIYKKYPELKKRGK